MLIVDRKSPLDHVSSASLSIIEWKAGCANIQEWRRWNKENRECYDVCVRDGSVMAWLLFPKIPTLMFMPADLLCNLNHFYLPPTVRYPLSPPSYVEYGPLSNTIEATFHHKIWLSSTNPNSLTTIEQSYIQFHNFIEPMKKIGRVTVVRGISGHSEATPSSN